MLRLKSGLLFIVGMLATAFLPENSLAPAQGVQQARESTIKIKTRKWDSDGTDVTYSPLDKVEVRVNRHGLKGGKAKGVAKSNVDTWTTDGKGEVEFKVDAGRPIHLLFMHPGGETVPEIIYLSAQADEKHQFAVAIHSIKQHIDEEKRNPEMVPAWVKVAQAQRILSGKTPNDKDKNLLKDLEKIAKRVTPIGADPLLLQRFLLPRAAPESEKLRGKVNKAMGAVFDFTFPPRTRVVIPNQIINTAVDITFEGMKEVVRLQCGTGLEFQMVKTPPRLVLVKRGKAGQYAFASFIQERPASLWVKFKDEFVENTEHVYEYARGTVRVEVKP